MRQVTAGDDEIAARAETRPLTLPEELLILSFEHDPRAHEGEPSRALAAARLAELAVRLRISVEASRVIRRVTVIDRSPTGDALLDPLLIELAKKRVSPGTANEQARGGEVECVDRLVGLGLLQGEQWQTRVLRRQRVRYELTRNAEIDAIHARIVRALAHPGLADLRTIALIAVACEAESVAIGLGLAHDLEQAGGAGLMRGRRALKAVSPARYKDFVSAGQASICDTLAAIVRTAKTPWEFGGG